MGANLVTDYKLRVSLDKMTYSPGEIVNGTFSFDFGKDQFKKKNLKIKNPAIAVTIIQTETVQATTQPKSRATTLLSQGIVEEFYAKLNNKNSFDVAVAKKPDNAHSLSVECFHRSE